MTSNERARKYTAQHRVEVLAWLGGKCEVCSESDYRVLQIAHVIPVRRKTRTSEDSGSLLVRSIRKLGEEKARPLFRLLCANDHLKETWDKREWSGKHPF